MLSYLLWILFGGIVGWLSILLPVGRTTSRPTVNVMTGIVGATLGGCAHDQVDREAAGASLTSVLCVLLVASSCVAIAHFAQRRRTA